MAPGQFTGRYLVLFREKETTQALKVLHDSAGLTKVARTADFANAAFEPDQVASSDVVVFDELSVALVSGDPRQMSSVAAVAAEDGAVISVEPERMNFAICGSGNPNCDRANAAEPVTPTPGPVSLEYLRGFRDAVNDLYDRLVAGHESAEAAGGPAPFQDTPQATWGLQAAQVDKSRRSGSGIRIAILDTGLDLNHPDFAGRVPEGQRQSFVAGQDVQDGHGHGTHVAGTACGLLHPATGQRYGVAYGAELFVGKVLSNVGSGPDMAIIMGINWAVKNKCQVVSMSLGSRVEPCEPFSQIYENVARRALDAGTLIVAAAGNDSRRPSLVVPVSRPANSPSILAVAALDQTLRVAAFSNGGINPQGGGVDLAAPGVAVISTWPMPARTRTISGTSMAAPHVAGVAALWAQARGMSGGALWQALTGSALRLPSSARDIGAGLVQAPVP
jgi:subtilisin family serine protease